MSEQDRLAAHGGRIRPDALAGTLLDPDWQPRHGMRRCLSCQRAYKAANMDPDSAPFDQVAEAVADERERIAAAAEALEAEEWRACGGNCHDHTIAAVLRIVRGEA